MTDLTLRLYKPNLTKPCYEGRIRLPEAEARHVQFWLNKELPFMLEAAICLHDDVQVSLSETDAASVQNGTPKAKAEGYPDG